MATERQIEKLARMLGEAFRYADQHEIFTTINTDGIEIEGKYAVTLPTIYTTVRTEENRDDSN